MVLAEQLLRLWEEHAGADATTRTLALLTLAAPAGRDAEGAGVPWLERPLGDEQQALLRLHEHWFGHELALQADCPHCGERLELTLDTRTLAGAADGAPTGREREIDIGGLHIVCRPPTRGDLFDAMALRGDAAVQRLLQRCIRAADPAAAAAEVGSLPAALIERIEQTLAEADPDADPSVGLHCPACGGTFERGLDIAGQLWSALDDWAGRVLADVHTLALAYGWSEREILALSAARRAGYVEMVMA
jgi:hypothetical protein